MIISFSSSPAVNLITLHPPPPSQLVPSASRFLRTPFAAKIHLLRLCSATSSDANGSFAFSVMLFVIVFNVRPVAFCSSFVEYNDSSGFDSSSIEKQGSNGKDDDSQPVSSNEILTRLKRYGISGILSYGLLNTAYYLTTFLVVWFYVAPAPGRMGYLAAVERFLKVMAMVWAGSQVTKLMRAAGALALAPVVDRGLSWFTTKMGFESQGKAFAAIVGICFGLAFLMFVVVTLLSA